MGEDQGMIDGAITIIIHDVAPSANRMYAGMHPMARRKLVSAWKTMVIVEARRQKLTRFRGKYPVDIDCVCRFGRGCRMTDADNCYLTAKLAIDGLVRAGVLVNDSPRYIRSVRFVPERSETGKSYSILTIREAGS